MHKTVVLIVVATVFLSGCSMYMAAKQPGKKNLELLSAGAKRDILIDEFGGPAENGKEGDALYDVFVFTKGYSAGQRAGRLLLHGTLSFLTTGLWEPVGMRMEREASKEMMKIKVIYDSDGLVKNVVDLTASDSTTGP